MKKHLLRVFYPDIFNMIKDKNTYFDIGCGSAEKIEFVCPRCGNIVIQSVCNVIRNGLSCKKCGDGISFGEKFVFNVLEQLNLNFDTHVRFEWSCNRIYDVVLYENDIPYTIIEIHGKQHYVGGFESYGGRDYLQELENDSYKKNLALSNGFNEDSYIIIDCKESRFEYVKKSIQNNIFFQKYNLDNINWNDCMKNAISSYAIKAQKLWNDGHKIEYISHCLKISRQTIRKYLKQGAELGICNYSIESSFKRRREGTFIPSAPCMVYSPELNSIFYSISDASRRTGVNGSGIHSALSGRYKYAGKSNCGEKLHWHRCTEDTAYTLVSSFGYKIIGDIPNYIFCSTT